MSRRTHRPGRAGKHVARDAGHNVARGFDAIMGGKVDSHIDGRHPVESIVVDLPPGCLNDGRELRRAAR